MDHRHLLPNEIDLLLDDEAGFGVQPLRAHVRRCAECRGELEAARAVMAELDRLPHFAPSPLFAQRVMANVRVFEPWHVAALDSLRRLVPQSRPARVLAGAGALSASLVLSLAVLWMATRLDEVVFLANVAIGRTREGVVGLLGDLLTTALGEPAIDALRGSGSAGIAMAATAFLLTLVAAALGLRALAVASRRRQE